MRQIRTLAVLSCSFAGAALALGPGAAAAPDHRGSAVVLCVHKLNDAKISSSFPITVLQGGDAVDSTVVRTGKKGSGCAHLHLPRGSYTAVQKPAKGFQVVKTRVKAPGRTAVVSKHKKKAAVRVTFAIGAAPTNVTFFTRHVHGGGHSH